MIGDFVTEWFNNSRTGITMALYIIVFGGQLLLCLSYITEKVFENKVKLLIISKHAFNYSVLLLIVGSIFSVFYF